jgi:hypothetical protein
MPDDSTDNAAGHCPYDRNGATDSGAGSGARHPAACPSRYTSGIDNEILAELCKTTTRQAFSSGLLN